MARDDIEKRLAERASRRKDSTMDELAQELRGAGIEQQQAAQDVNSDAARWTPPEK